MSKVVSRGECPSCGSSDAFTTFSEGIPYCFSCGHKGKGEKVEYKQRDSKPADISLYATYPARQLTHKPIPLDVSAYYGVKVGVSETTGEVDRVFYPYCGDDNSVIGYKIRKLPKDFHAEGKVAKAKLFGQQLFKEGRQLLIITEGEDDAMSAYTLLKLTGRDYPVVSIASGANISEVSADIKANYEYIISHKTVMLCFDNDKVGKAYANLVAEFLCGACEVKIVAIPEGYKDVSDILISINDKANLLDENKRQAFLDRGAVKFYTFITNARTFSPESVVRGDEVCLEDVKRKKPEGFVLPYPELNNKLHGLRKGEITLFCAGSGIGKTTLVKEIAYDLVRTHKQTVGNIFLETPMEDAVRGYIALDNGVSAAKLAYRPDLITQEAYQESFDALVKSNKLHFFKHFGSIASNKLVSKLNYFVKALGCDFIILDHVSMVVAGQESDNERKDLDSLMEALTKVVVETGVGIIAVVHLKRSKDKNFNKGAEVELVDLRGSAGLEQMSWSVIALERDQQGDSKDFSKIRVLKNRTFGYTGICDTLKYEHDSGRLLPVQVEGY